MQWFIIISINDLSFMIGILFYRKINKKIIFCDAVCVELYTSLSD